MFFSVKRLVTSEKPSHLFAYLLTAKQITFCNLFSFLSFSHNQKQSGESICLFSRQISFPLLTLKLTDSALSFSLVELKAQDKELPSLLTPEGICVAEGYNVCQLQPNSKSESPAFKKESNFFF